MRVLAAFFPFQLRNCWGSGEWSLSAAAAGGRGAVERMLVKVDILYTTPVMNLDDDSCPQPPRTE